MTCPSKSSMGLEEPHGAFDALELRLIIYLHQRRCVSPRRAKRREAILRDMRGSWTKKEVMRALKRLMNLRIVWQTKKGKAGKIHYYVDPGEARRILEAYGKLYRV